MSFQLLVNPLETLTIETVQDRTQKFKSSLKSTLFFVHILGNYVPEVKFRVQ